MFVLMLRRKAESAGGKVEEFSTYKTALSQTCHCGRVKKKSLSERWHDCCYGTSAQRDLYSAFFAQFVENDHLDRRQPMQAWPAAEPLLEHAVSRCLRQEKESLKPFRFPTRKSRGNTPFQP
ncbi:MAG: zinc ribbon domain-containing protein [Waddliaceae bacterium]